MNAILAALVAFLLAALGHPAPGPTPAPHGVTVSPATPAPALRAPATATAGQSPRPPALPRPRDEGAAPTVAPDPAPQLDAEVIGREVECPDGSVGVVVDAALTVRCP